jgi:hypothetical protein
MCNETIFFVQIDEYVSSILKPHYKPNLLHYGDKCKHLETKTIKRAHWHEVAKDKEKKQRRKRRMFIEEWKPFAQTIT